jgi:hypothetical protein
MAKLITLVIWNGAGRERKRMEMRMPMLGEEGGRKKWTRGILPGSIGISTYIYPKQTRYQTYNIDAILHLLNGIVKAAAVSEVVLMQGRMQLCSWIDVIWIGRYYKY